MYKYENSMLPDCFAGTLLKKRDVHYYNTRIAHDFRSIKHHSDILKLNTMQLVTPGGNHCSLMANDVQNSRLVHSFINFKHCI